MGSISDMTYPDEVPVGLIGGNGGKKSKLSMLTDLQNLQIGPGLVTATQFESILSVFQLATSFSRLDIFKWLMECDRVFDSATLHPLLVLLSNEKNNAVFDMLFQFLSQINNI